MSNFNLRSDLEELQDKTKLNLFSAIIILKKVCPAISKTVIKALLDSKKVSPFDKDDHHCSPMFYSKLLEDVPLTSLLFDYIVYYKKQMATKKASFWWIKMRTRPSFHI
jgi:hypothetical protein